MFFGKKDGIEEPGFGVAASYQAPDGKLFFGAPGKAIMFDPEKINNHKDGIPAVQITEFKLGNQFLLVDSLMERSNIELGYHENVLEISFSAMDHNNGYDVYYMLEGADKQGARALVEDLLSIAGISSVGGRSVSEITERFLEQASLRSGPGVPQDKRDLIAKFLAVSGDPDAASAALRKLAGDAKLDLTAALDSFDQRLNFIVARGLDPATMSFSARFVRRLDYYTGFIFEAHGPGLPPDKPVIGGGRYDRLLGTLGAKKDIPAVGAAVWVERLFPEAQP